MKYIIIIQWNDVSLFNSKGFLRGNRKLSDWMSESRRRLINPASESKMAALLLLTHLSDLCPIKHHIENIKRQDIHRAFREAQNKSLFS